MHVALDEGQYREAPRAYYIGERPDPRMPVWPYRSNREDLVKAVVPPPTDTHTHAHTRKQLPHRGSSLGEGANVGGCLFSHCDCVSPAEGMYPPPPPLYKLRPCPSYSRRRDRNNCVRNFNYVRNVVRPHKTWVCRHICQLHGAMDTCNMPHTRQIHSQEFEVVRVVHPYHARAHVCVGSCMCFAQATPLSKLQWA